MSDVRDAITNAISGLQALLVRYDEAAKAINSLSSVKAQLVSARADAEQAAAEVAEGKRVLVAARIEHEREMDAMRAARDAARAQVAGLVAQAGATQAEIDGMQTRHDEVFASTAVLRKRLELGQ
jgi:hypothetical protein